MSYSDAVKSQNGKSIIEKVIEIQSAHRSLLPEDNEVLMVFSNSNLDVAKALYADMTGYLEKAVPRGTKTPSGKSLIATMNACDFRNPHPSDTCIAARAQYQGLMNASPAGPIAQRGGVGGFTDKLSQAAHRATGAPIEFMSAAAKNDRESDIRSHKDSPAYAIGNELLNKVVEVLGQETAKMQSIMEMGGSSLNPMLNQEGKEKITEFRAKGAASQDAATLASKSRSSEDWFSALNSVVDHYSKEGVDYKTKNLLDGFMAQANGHNANYGKKIDSILKKDDFVKSYCDELVDIRNAFADELFTKSFRDGSVQAEQKIQEALIGIPPGSTSAAAMALDKLGREIHGDEGYDANLKSATKAYLDRKGKGLVKKYGNVLNPEQMKMVKRDIVANVPNYGDWVDMFNIENAKNGAYGPAATMDIDNPKTLPKNVLDVLGQDIVKGMYHAMGDEGVIRAAQYMQGTLTDEMIAGGKREYIKDLSEGVAYELGNSIVLSKTCPTWDRFDKNKQLFDTLSYPEQVAKYNEMRSELIKAAKKNGIENNKAINIAVAKKLDDFQPIEERSRKSHQEYKDHRADVHQVGSVSISNRAILDKPTEAYMNKPELVKKNMRTNGELNAFGRFMESTRHLSKTKYQPEVFGEKEFVTAKGVIKRQRTPDEIQEDIRDIVDSVDVADRNELFSPEMIALAEQPIGKPIDWDISGYVDKASGTGDPMFVQAGMDPTDSKGMANFELSRSILNEWGGAIPQEPREVVDGMIQLEDDIRNDAGMPTDKLNAAYDALSRNKGKEYANKLLRDRYNGGNPYGRERLVTAGVYQINDSEDAIYSGARSIVDSRRGLLDPKYKMKASDYREREAVLGSKGAMDAIRNLRAKRMTTNKDETQMFDFSKGEIENKLTDFAQKTGNKVATLADFERDGDAQLAAEVDMHVKALIKMAKANPNLAPQVENVIRGTYNWYPPVAQQPPMGTGMPPANTQQATATPPAPTMITLQPNQDWKDVAADPNTQKDVNFQAGNASLNRLKNQYLTHTGKDSEITFLKKKALEKYDAITNSATYEDQMNNLGAYNALISYLDTIKPTTTQTTLTPPATQAPAPTVAPQTPPPTAPTAPKPTPVPVVKPTQKLTPKPTPAPIATPPVAPAIVPQVPVQAPAPQATVETKPSAPAPVAEDLGDVTPAYKLGYTQIAPGKDEKWLTQMKKIFEKDMKDPNKSDTDRESIQGSLAHIDKQLQALHPQEKTDVVAPAEAEKTTEEVPAAEKPAEDVKQEKVDAERGSDTPDYAEGDYVPPEIKENPEGTGLYAPQAPDEEPVEVATESVEAPAEEVPTEQVAEVPAEEIVATETQTEQPVKNELTDEEVKAKEREMQQKKQADIGITYGEGLFAGYKPTEQKNVELTPKEKEQKAIADNKIIGDYLKEKLQKDIRNRIPMKAKMGGVEYDVENVKMMNGNVFLKLAGDSAKVGRSLNSISAINGKNPGSILSEISNTGLADVQKKAMERFTPEEEDKIKAQRQDVYSAAKESAFGKGLDQKDARGKTIGAFEPREEASKAHWDAALSVGRMTGNPEKDALLIQNAAHKLGERDGWLARMKSGNSVGTTSSKQELGANNPVETYKDVLSAPMSETSNEVANDAVLKEELGKVSNIKSLDSWFNEKVAIVLNDTTGVHNESDKEVAIGELHAYLARRKELESIPQKQSNKPAPKGKVEPTVRVSNSVKNERKAKGAIAPVVDNAGMDEESKAMYDKAYEEQSASFAEQDNILTAKDLGNMIKELEASVALGDENKTLAEDKGYLKATQDRLSAIHAEEARQAAVAQREKERMNSEAIAAQRAQREKELSQTASVKADPETEKEVIAMLRSSAIVDDESFMDGEGVYIDELKSMGVPITIAVARPLYNDAINAYKIAATPMEQKALLPKISVLKDIVGGKLKVK